MVAGNLCNYGSHISKLYWRLCKMHTQLSTWLGCCMISLWMLACYSIWKQYSHITVLSSYKYWMSHMDIALYSTPQMQLNTRSRAVYSCTLKWFNHACIKLLIVWCHEMMKKSEYGDRVWEVELASFTPLVFSTTGGMGREGTVFYRRLANLLASK